MSKAFLRESDDEPPAFKKRAPIPKTPAFWEIGGARLHPRTITVRNARGEAARYRIVGAEEIDAGKNWVSRSSPIGRALANARVGETVRFKAPAGETELEVTEIADE
jgi:hypothetical protein